ncbi:MAG TPA: fatty acid biosynthesis transcriptional regulator [Candidatus Ornithomonoglobus intestinigallinarum]|uniref:Fatty acid biosynthesis transcriptional regulator n=1 Tax=Candidatus Ornithomonoglobus intestinigallinarum TaxID=2840894 RepID=A0A9D1H3J8_9FIRM|nr:fatty acid biosynthesis transcriptional regulator [Candidatus Ornithomonoglobus intestinigallinarum]
MARSIKSERHAYLLEKLRKNPFLKDKDLAKAFGVSVSTIRFDRAELGIAEYRERVKNAAREGMNGKDTEGELLDLNVYHDGISVLKTDESMVFDGTDIVKSQFIYAFAENLALNVIDARSMLVKVANVKYIEEVHAGESLVAKSVVMRDRSNEFVVHVHIKVNMVEVFRGKFSLKVLG